MQCVYDSFSGVLEAKLLDHAPFDVVDMHPQRYKTDQLISRSTTNPSYSAIIGKLNDYESIMTTRKLLPSIFEKKAIISKSDLSKTAGCDSCGSGSPIDMSGFKPATTTAARKRVRFSNDFVTDDEGSEDMLLDE